MRILGIDPSFTATGLAILDDGQYVEGHVVKTSPSMTDGVRLQQIFNRVRLLCREHHFDAVAMEGYAHNAKFNRELMGQVGGVIKLALSLDLIEPVIWPPRSWRETTLGEAGAQKDRVRLVAFQRYGIDLRDHNELEAVLVAMAEHLAQTGAKRPRPKKSMKIEEEAA